MSVLFVQLTENSALKKMYEEIISQSECNVKVVERAGINVKRSYKSNTHLEKKNVKINVLCVCLRGKETEKVVI